MTPADAAVTIAGIAFAAWLLWLLFRPDQPATDPTKLRDLAADIRKLNDSVRQLNDTLTAANKNLRGHTDTPEQP